MYVYKFYCCTFVHVINVHTVCSANKIRKYESTKVRKYEGTKVLSKYFRTFYESTFVPSKILTLYFQSTFVLCTTTVLYNVVLYYFVRKYIRKYMYCTVRVQYIKKYESTFVRKY